MVSIIRFNFTSLFYIHTIGICFAFCLLKRRLLTAPTFFFVKISGTVLFDRRFISLDPLNLLEIYIKCFNNFKKKKTKDLIL